MEFIESNWHFIHKQIPSVLIENIAGLHCIFKYFCSDVNVLVILFTLNTYKLGKLQFHLAF